MEREGNTNKKHSKRERINANWSKRPFKIENNN